MACNGDPVPAPDEEAEEQEAPEEVDTEATAVIAWDEDQWSNWEDHAATMFAFPLNADVYETLILIDPDYELQPALAESWELIDGETWRFHLREDVTWHDGSPFTADDVVWTWGPRAQEGERPVGYETLGPDSVVAVDDFTVDITPEVPNLRFLEQVGHPNGSIVQDGRHMDSDPPIGTGPFRVVDYVEGQHGEFERYDDYWGEPAGVAGFTVRFLPDPTSRVQALQAGEVDFAGDVPSDAVAGLANDPDVTITQTDPSVTAQILINRAGEEPHHLGADPAVRQAIGLAIDREVYIEVVHEGAAEPGRWMAPGSILGDHADDVDPPEFDPDEAASILEGAGWQEGDDGVRERDGERLELTLLGGPDLSRSAFDLVQSQLGDVGIQVSVRRASDRPAYDQLRDDGWDLDIATLNQNDANPGIIPQAVLDSREAILDTPPYLAPEGEFDEMSARVFAAETTEEAQEAAAELMQTAINEERVIVPLAHVGRTHASRAGVTLLQAHPSGTNHRWRWLVVSAEE